VSDARVCECYFATQGEYPISCQEVQMGKENALGLDFRR
jgi:hypothetical protein